MAEFNCKFDRYFNELYRKCKSASSKLICVELLKSYCLPIIFYACEAVWPNISSITSLERIINQAVSKIFCTFDQNDVNFIHAVVNFDDARAMFILVLLMYGNMCICNCAYVHLCVCECVCERVHWVSVHCIFHLCDNFVDAAMW
jgi:hypothetical protein